MINYLLESSVCLLIMLLLYRLLLAKTALHQIKRVFLLACLLVPLAWPLVSVDIYYEQDAIAALEENSPRWTGLNVPEEQMTPGATEPKAEAGQAITTAHANETKTPVNWIALAIWMYAIISSVLLIRLLVQVRRIKRLAHQSEQKYFQDYRLVLLEKMASPYSFFRYIFMGKPDFEEANTKRQLIAHELIHVKQWHSLDVLFIELCKAIFWFNPMYWLLGKSIRLNHEFIADAGAIATSGNKQDYQNMLLQFYQRPRVHSLLVSPSDFSFIKNRFQMMQKTTQKKSAVLRLLLLIPVLGGVLFSFAMDLKPKPKANHSTPEIIQTPFTSDVPNGFPIDSVLYSVDLSDLPTIPVHYMTNTYPGIDITSKKGKSVVTSADGVVKEVSLDNKDYGKYILVEHNDEYSTLYASLDAVSVKPGDPVKQGEKLGTVGTSMVVHAVARAIPRVHYAVRKNGAWTSPYKFIKLPPQPQAKRAGFTAAPFGYGRSLDVVADERIQPSILPFEAAANSYLVFTGKTSDPNITINSVYDSRMGTEFFSIAGTKVRATADGIVTNVVSNHEKYGNYVVIQHGKTFETIYAKLDEVSVTNGQSIQRGKAIGKIGKANELLGRLHYKVKRGGFIMSPNNYFTSVGAHGPYASFFGKPWSGFNWDFPSGFAFKSIQYNQEEVVFTKSSGAKVTRKATDLSQAEKIALLSINRKPYSFPAKRPVPEEVYSRWEKPWAYKIFLDGKHIESKEMVNYQPEDFEHCSWVVVSKAVKKRNGYAFELRLQTKAYYDQLKKDHLKREQDWKNQTQKTLSSFKNL